ncbi:MAG: phage baseplate assembly protein V [Micromonosporaceae bacterium]|nr:phage baseplate assembly protein V [Micromonosporaceae bacterium]
MTIVQARSRSADQRYYGVVPALVAEVDGDDEARVKVSFPWYDPGTVTDWCRVNQLYAGNGYGSVFIPEKGDEVLVAFVHGDMRFPIVLGGLYNGKDKPPATRQDGHDRKLIRTRHGHQIVFDDQSGHAAVRITSAGGHVVELDDEGKAVKVTAAAGGSVSVTADGAISLTSKESVTIDAPKVTLRSGNVDLGGGATEPAVHGNELVTQFAAHVHGTGVGPSTPPTTPLTALSGTVRTT